MACLHTHSWPGNARELRNILATAALLSPFSQIDVADIEEAMRRLVFENTPQITPPNAYDEIYKAHGGNVSAAARALGIPRSTLRNRLRLPAKSPNA